MEIQEKIDATPKCKLCRQGIKLDKGNVLTYSIIEKYGMLIADVSKDGTNIDMPAIKTALELSNIPQRDWDRHAQKIILYYGSAGGAKRSRYQEDEKGSMKTKLNKKTGGKKNGTKKRSK